MSKSILYMYLYSIYMMNKRDWFDLIWLINLLSSTDCLACKSILTDLYWLMCLCTSVDQSVYTPLWIDVFMHLCGYAPLWIDLFMHLCELICLFTSVDWSVYVPLWINLFIYICEFICLFTSAYSWLSCKSDAFCLQRTRAAGGTMAAALPVCYQVFPRRCWRCWWEIANKVIRYSA